MTRAGLWQRLTPRIILVASLAGAVSVIGVGLVWTQFFISEIMVQVGGYTDEVVVDNLPLCQQAPETWGRLRKVGRFDAYDASTLRSRNPESPTPDPELVARLRAGEARPARIFWSVRSGWGGYVLRQVAPSGPCSLFQLQFDAPAGSGLRGAALLGLMTVMAIVVAIALATALAVNPLVGRLLRLRSTAGLVGAASGYESAGDSEADEIGQLSEILDRAHQRIRDETSRLRERERTLERHLADVSHDLRTPLTSAQLALEQAVELVDEPSAKDLLRQALVDTVYTGELTANLRLATQLREGVDPLADSAETDLAEIVERVVARFVLLGRLRGVSVDGATPETRTPVHGHPVWTEQAIANLVHNAVAHGNAGGHVAVVLETSQPSDFTLSVTDDGPGIAPDELERVTERHVRADGAALKAPAGGGLGLAIASDVCRSYGWKLSFEPRTPQGLRVIIEGSQLAGRASER